MNLLSDIVVAHRSSQPHAATSCNESCASHSELREIADRGRDECDANLADGDEETRREMSPREAASSRRREISASRDRESRGTTDNDKTCPRVHSHLASDSASRDPEVARPIHHSMTSVGAPDVVVTGGQVHAGAVTSSSQPEVNSTRHGDDVASANQRPPSQRKSFDHQPSCDDDSVPGPRSTVLAPSDSGLQSLYTNYSRSHLSANVGCAQQPSSVVVVVGDPVEIVTRTR